MFQSVYLIYQKRIQVGQLWLQDLYDYLKAWYPNSKVKTRTTTPVKYKELKIDGDIYKLHSKVKDVCRPDYINF